MSFVVASSPFFWLLLPDQEDRMQAFFLNILIVVIGVVVVKGIFAEQLLFSAI